MGVRPRQNIHLLLLALSPCWIYATEPISFQSPATRVQVIELFTSQGCSSCPPAERWLSQFIDYPGLWTEIVPIAFHVNYWDGLGWEDPFATKASTQRQYAHAKRGNISNVYTPCFVANGKEWRGFFDRSSLPKTSTRAAVLKATLQGDRLQAEFLKPKQRLDLHVVILACDLATDVRRGENRGKILKEQFVAIHHGTHQGDSNQWHLRLPAYEVRDGSRYALALFVTERGALEPLQATGGWLRH